MNNFMDRDFLLGSETARTLYHDYASVMPVIDYHCHIDAAEICNDRCFADLTELWLAGDHYKWRLMRACGVSEDLITGNGSAMEKFMEFARILPLAVSNPIYSWVHLELQRFFDITAPLNQDTAPGIWEQTCIQLQGDASLSARGIIKRMNVEVIVTTDDPADDLQYHAALSRDSTFGTKVLPCFRPDAALGIERDGFAQCISRLGEAARQSITTYNDLKAVLAKRIEHFDSLGCPAADHGLLTLAYAPATDKEVNDIFTKAMNGEQVSKSETEKYRYALLLFLAREYASLGWVMELHLGPLRNVNSSLHGRLGADTGFDCIGVPIDIVQLAKFLDALSSAGKLPKTLIFSINPNDNAPINTLAACFCGDGVRGKVQQGSAWWFNDSLGGIRSQLQSFAENGVLGNFIGMLTDSRSFTSYPRHEYFRRILCSFLGELVENGIYPYDMNYLGKLTGNLCYNNVKKYFEFQGCSL